MKSLLKIQSVVLLGGSLFAWYTVYTDFKRFYDVEGTLFRVQDCIIPNPVTTPCFYGAFAFLIAFIWSLYIINWQSEKRSWHQSRLVWLLIASTLFAWGNFGFTLYKFWLSKGAPTIGCSGVLSTSPWVTPCFTGAVMFLIALIVGIVLKKKLQNTQPVSV